MSAGTADNVPPAGTPSQARVFPSRRSAALGTGSSSPRGKVSPTDHTFSPVQGAPDALEASLPSLTVPPPPQEGGRHHGSPPLPEGGLHHTSFPHVGVLTESTAGGVLLDPLHTAGNHAPSSQDDTFVSAQEMLPESAGVWRTQRWEHHRLQQCRRLGRDSGPVVPLMERLANMPEHTQTLGYGIRRTSVGTWVTTSAGQSAFYPRRAREYDEWDLDEDQNIRDPFPRHPSFDATVDEDDYFIDYTSCTSNFSFTAHPEDYEGCVIVPPTSISIRRHVTSLEEDIREAWPVAEESQHGGGSGPHRDDVPRLQRDTVAAIALTIDDVLAHILDIFARNRDLAAKIVGARDEADSSILQLSGYVATTVTELKECITQEFEDLRTHFDDELDTVADDFHDQVKELEKRILALEHRVDMIPSTSPVPPLTAIRVSLASMERAATTRLSDHANSLMASLARRRMSRSRGETGGRSSGASGWSVASDSQLSVDAPADHGGDSPPLPVRGGCATISHQAGMASSCSPKMMGSVDCDRVSPTLAEKSDNTSQGINGSLQCGVAPGLSAKSGCFPTPWSTNGNLFSARENAASAAATARDMLAPRGDGTTEGDIALPHSHSSARDAPDEVFMHGQYYARVPPPDGFKPACNTPPGLELGPSLLLPSTHALTTLSKFWHGGGMASSYMTGVDALPLEQVVKLGVPPSMAFVVVSTHHQVYTQWMRMVERDQVGPRRGYSDFGSRVNGESSGRSFGPNPLHEAIKHTGWQELP